MPKSYVFAINTGDMIAQLKNQIMTTRVPVTEQPSLNRRAVPKEIVRKKEPQGRSPGVFAKLPIR
jgi:hypothetical protein